MNFKKKEADIENNKAVLEAEKYNSPLQAWLFSDYLKLGFIIFLVT